MKIFEFQFNPKAKEDRFFSVFSHEAQQDELERGTLYMLGELQNALPNNAQFLERLASLIQQEYYNAEKPAQSAAQRLRHALKKANAFLAEESKNGNVNWLGNLHFLLLLFVPATPQGGLTSQGYTLYFAKAGSMKLWIGRGGSLVDAGKSIESTKDQESFGKVFGNVGSGKVLPHDRIIGVTQEAFDFFSKENFLQTISQLKEQKQFKKIFRSKQKEMSLLQGVLFFVLVEAIEQSETETAKMPSISLPDFSFIKQRLPFLPSLEVRGSLTSRLPLTWFLMLSQARKRMSLLALLCFVLLLGFAMVGDERKPKSTSSLSAAVSQTSEITEEFRALHKITEVTEPKIVLELDASIATAQLEKMVQQGSKFYFFGSSSPNVFVFDSAVNASEIFGAGKNLDFGTPYQDFVLFFAAPHTMFSMDGRNIIVQHELSLPSQDSQLDGVAQFAANLYFFDSRNGEIFKSPILSSSPTKVEPWLDPLSSKKPINARSMSVDGNIWILTSKNEIQRYFRGKYQESLIISLVPAFQNAAALKTGSQIPYLYVLEPEQQRLVVLRKSGELVRQYHGPVFGAVRDFVVSPHDQTLYLFTGTKVYQISPDSM